MIEYRDDFIRVMLPGFLRFQAPHPKSQTIDWCFFADAPQRQKVKVDNVLISLVSRERAKREQRSLTQVRPIHSEGMEFRIIRRGRSQWVSDGEELLSGNYNTVDGQVYLAYILIFFEAGQWIRTQIAGSPGLSKSEFEAICGEIVKSLRLNSIPNAPSDLRRGASKSSAGIGLATSGMCPDQRSRLRRAIDRLPNELSYLGSPILKLAKEDQDLLGSGEGDIRPLGRALRKIAVSEEIEDVAARHAEALREWLVAQPDHEANWAKPVWFIIGALSGGVLFGMNGA